MADIPQMDSSFVNMPEPPARKAADFLNAYSSWVYTCVNAIAQAVADINLHLYQRTFSKNNKEVTIDEVMEHEALSLLSHVNQFQTGYQLIEITQIYLELTGEAYWVKLRSTDNKPNELWALRPDWVSVVKDRKKFISGYKYSPLGTGDKDAVIIPVEDMIPFKYPNPTNPYRGKGAVQAAAMAIDTDLFSADWNRNFFFNSAVPYMIMRTKKKPQKEILDKFVRQWEAKYQGKANSHKIALLTGEWEEPFVFGNKFKEMDFIEQRRLMRDEILATFRVGKSTLNITEDVNRANAEASNINFMERVITPKMKRLVAHLNEFYLTEWIEGENKDLFFDFEDPAPQDTELNLKIYENAKNYWMTPNEIREKENLPPLKGGDIIPVPFTLQPLEDLGQTVVESIKNFFSGKKAETRGGVMVLEGDGKGAPRKFMMPIPARRLQQFKKDKLAEAVRADLYKLVKQTIIKMNDDNGKEKSKSELKGAGWDKQKRDSYWDSMVAKTDVFEKKFRDKVAALFSDQEEVVLGKVEQLKYYATNRKKGKESNFLFDIVKENKRWKKILSPVIRAIVQDKGDEVLRDLGIDVGLDTGQQAAQLFLSVEGLAFIKDVNEHTRERLKAELAEGIGKEEGIPDLKKRVEKVFDVAKGSRAQTIARTETIRSTNFAAEEAFKQSDIVEGKEWLTAKDERVDDECATLDGETVELKDSFIKGVEFPPLHPNCRCTLIPIVG